MDLRDFIVHLEQINQLKRVEGADWDLEIGAITELSEERSGPALLFDRVKGYPPGFRVATNLLSTPGRLSTALGIPHDAPRMEMVRLMKDKFRQATLVPPTPVRDGPVLENVVEEKDVDLLRFPVPKWHEYDGGRYLGTGDMVIMRDPKDGWVNAGTYRIQVHDRNTLGLYISQGHHGRTIRESYWAQGKSCPVAVVFGAHPLVWMPSLLNIPWGTEEYAVAGGYLGQSLPVVTGEYTGLPIPAHSEIVVEGECPPPEVESRMEGPFGEWTGYYGSGERKEPVIRVKRIMYRRDPIIHGAPPLKPPASGDINCIMGAGNIWSSLEKLGIPGIKGVWNLRSGSFRYLFVVAIEQKYAGHAKQVGLAVSCSSEGAYHGRFVIVVDDDIDPSNYEDVLWAVATRCDPATSIEVINGCWSSVLDPILSPDKKAKGDFTNSRAILSACRPYHWRKDFPAVNRASDELRDRTMKKWRGLLFRKD